MYRQTYLVPEKGVPLKHIRSILKGNGCAGCQHRDRGNHKCAHCVLQGTAEGSCSNEPRHVNVDKFIERLIKYKVITKAEALDLTLYQGD
jgi:hypothetical protein